MDPDRSAAWADLIALGWPGMLAAEQADGQPLDLSHAAEILRAAGEHVAPEPLLAIAGLSTSLLTRLPGAGARRLLAELAAGRGLPALAWQERHGDLSPRPLACRCVSAEGGMLLHGEKLMVLPGAAASGWLLSARNADADAGADDTVLLWVPRGSAGVSETLLALVDGEQAADLRFRSVAVSPCHVLGHGSTARMALRHALVAGAHGSGTRQSYQFSHAPGVGQPGLCESAARSRL